MPSDEVADYVATLEARLLLAEDVCLMFGWSSAREDAPRHKAATFLWQRWALLVGDDYLRPQNHPHLNDEAVAEMAAARDAKVAETLRRIDGPGSPQWDAECQEFGCHDHGADT